MTTNRIAAIVGGAALFILGLIIGAAISGGPSVEEIDAAVAKRIDAASAAETAQIGKVEAGLTQLAGDLGGRLDGIAGTVDTGAKAAADLGTKIGGDVQTLGQSLQGVIEKSSSEHRAALESGLAGLRGQNTAAPAAAPAAAAGAAPGAAAPAASAAPVEGFGPGETAVLSDGALRVFVSGVGDGSARLAVNGVQTVTVAVGEGVEATAGDKACTVTVEGIDRGRVALGYVCG